VRDSAGTTADLPNAVARGVDSFALVDWVEVRYLGPVRAARYSPPGPIELVTYDEGGCGDDPECPPIIKTVVPLTLES